ncbi:MAG: histidine phosphatase family protein [Sulfuricurvum sp.]|jgi:broad specificity phosphatase PhoE|uniref:histidine phosphatase family protein n=1 Tax=Sulfuricurvum sp. TaxID=2025608 RepID=UPI0025F37CFD|nr:histidine phosphatase family protein [Sulfuricurvum sp.]MCK9371912.1 histidine phosphatase family protein [Sulfuricurvum sp.]
MGIILLRHAPPAAEYHGRYNGHTDIPIDPTLFDETKIAALAHQKFDRIYASDLCRCTETLRRMGMEHFTTDPRLREVRFKPLIEGKSFEQIERMENFDPRALESMESWHAYVCDEPLEMFRERVQSFLEELPNDETILICSHGGTIGMIRSLLDTTPASTPLGYLDHHFLG